MGTAVPVVPSVIPTVEELRQRASEIGVVTPGEEAAVKKPSVLQLRKKAKERAKP